MRDFTGFPPGSLACTPLPNLFFAELLPPIDDLAELKLTLHAFWRLHQRKGFPRYLTRRELESDGVLLRSLHSDARGPTAALAEALQRAVDRHTLLHLGAEVGGKAEDVYLLNDGRGREAVERLRRGELDLGVRTVILEPPTETKAERPGIFELYEQNLGLLTPLIVDELAEAQSLYPADWIEEAFRLAVEYNRRNWRYVRRILERWAVEGKR